MVKASLSPYEVHLRLFGAPRLTLRNAAVEVDTRKAIALLAYLVVTGRRHSREHLAALLWPDADSSHAHGALRRTLSTLNSALKGQGLIVERDAVEAMPAVWCDVVAFRNHVQAGRWREAVALYAGGFMAGFSLRDSAPFEEWQLAEAEALQRELADALAAGAGEETVAGHLALALDYARRWLSLDPLHEAAHRTLMQILAHQGDRPAALRQYRECVRVLNDELGVPPLKETTELYEVIKAGALPPLAQLPAEPAPTAWPDTTEAALTGRETQWAMLRHAHEAAATHEHVVALEGEAGIGKTRLVHDFLDIAHSQGAQVLAATCYEGESSLAYAPLLSMARAIAGDAAMMARLAELPEPLLAQGARLLPALHGARNEEEPMETPDTLAAQVRFFDSITQILSAALVPPWSPGQASILFIDDAQWADEATLDLLAYAARRLASQPLLLVLAWRSELSPAQHRLRQIYNTASREHHTSLITLDRLSLRSTHALLKDAFAGDDRMDDAALHALAKKLQKESEGLPLFVTEYIAMARRDRGILQNEWAMPESVRDMLHARLAGLGDAHQQLLGAAAVIGRAFDDDLLMQVSGRSDDETAEGLERLTRGGLLRETPAQDGYDFIHDKLREVVYARLDLSRRRLLHRRAAEALLARGRGLHNINQGALQIAQHYRQAGRDAEAARFFKQAGDDARAVFANAEALSHYSDALALGHEAAVTLHEAIGDLHTLAGDYPAALVSYERAAAQSVNGVLAGIEHKLGNVHHRRGEWALAENHYRAALALRGDCKDAALCAQLMADWSLNAHRSGADRHARQLAKRALALAERSTAPAALARVHNILGVLTRKREAWHASIAAFERSLDFAQQLGDPAARIAAINNLALALADHGEAQRALPLLQEALALCAAQGDRHHEAALHNNIADVRHALGDHAGALADLKQAVQLFAEIGVDVTDRTWQPEIWRLTEW